MQHKYSRTFEELKCCVLVPTFNNAGTLGRVLDGILKFTQQIIVINDGSTDNTSAILEGFTLLTVITVVQNTGKGNALRKGFDAARNLGFRYAISIDSDGQHNPDDLPRFLSKIESEPDTLIVGTRNMLQEGIPGKSSFGNTFSNFWFAVETGIRLPDTQSGFRLYPLEKLADLRFYTSKFEFEIEVLVRAAWRGISIKPIPVEVHYEPSGQRISHFRPFRDFTRISMLNTLLVLLALFYFRPVLYFRDFSYLKFKKLIGQGEPAVSLATAVGFGVFMGIVPIWGWQMIAAAFLAHLFRLNKALVLLASNISFGPMVAVIIYLSFLAGRFFVDQPVDLLFNFSLGLENIKVAAIQYITGSLLLASCAGLLAGFTSYIALLIRRKGNGQ
jgi:glycosyltransferase involved in cell wall biosynthesis